MEETTTTALPWYQQAWSDIWNWATSAAKNVARSLVTWEWTKAVLYWIVLSAGTMSELAFLIASLWMTLNASIHDFILVFLPEQMTLHISDIAKAAYVGLPECILPLAIATTIGHIRICVYSKKGKRAWAVAWSLLYGLPTATFLGLSLWTIGCSVLKIGYTLPDWAIVCRALAGYTYGITALLYWIIGKPQEADRLQEKDDLLTQIKEAHAKFVADLSHEKDGIIATLKKEKDDIVLRFQQENTNNLATVGIEKQGLLQQIESQKREIAQLKELFETVKTEKQQLFEALNQSNEDALQAYSSECFEWLNSGVRSATIEEIVKYTGHKKAKIEGAINRGILKTATHSKEIKVLITSLIPWLKQNLPSDKGPALRIVNE